MKGNCVLKDPKEAEDGLRSSYKIVNDSKSRE